MDPAQPGHALKEAKDVLVEGREKARPVRAHVADYLGLLQMSERRLVKAFAQTRDTHPDEPDIGPICHMFGEWSKASADALEPFVQKYGERREGEPERLDRALLVQRQLDWLHGRIRQAAPQTLAVPN